MKGNRFVILSAFTASLGGLLFGFDTAVISGAEKDIQQLFNLDGFWHGFTIAIALIGTLVGALISAKPADVYGRKNALLIIAILYTVSAIGSALAQTWVGFLVYRFIGGIGVGASSVIGPMYIAEIAPARLRGRLVTAFQLNIVLGIVISYFSNFWIAQVITHDAWRWMLGVESFPAIAFFFLVIFIPDSPRWLVLKGKIKEAKIILHKIGSGNPSNEIQEIEASISKNDGMRRETLFSSIYLKPLVLAILVALFNQLSGINAIMYYAPRIFEMAGFAQDSALLQSVSVGITLLIFTLVGMFLVDRVGRKKLLLVGSVGMVFFLGMVAKTVFNTATQGSVWMLIYLSGFIAFFAFSQGTVIWVFISEIFPNSVRAKGQTLGSFTHWAAAVVISWMFPAIAENSGGGWAFIFFSVAMAMQFLIVWKFFPETKGKSLEMIQKEMIK
ncbi:MAG TPA: sugar porter family MFS transporter [Prolixibacteraceae bacterium]|nr:sugar porter family MFS transporter [Prolixibacteraceae bacterium]